MELQRIIEDSSLSTEAKVILLTAEIATWAEIPTYLTDDVRTCPAAEATYKEHPSLADAIEVYLRRQQLAIKTLLL